MPRTPWVTAVDGASGRNAGAPVASHLAGERRGLPLRDHRIPYRVPTVLNVQGQPFNLWNSPTFAHCHSTCGWHLAQLLCRRDKKRFTVSVA